MYVCAYIYIHTHVDMCAPNRCTMYSGTQVYIYMYVHMSVYIFTHTRECVYSQPLYYVLRDTGIHVYMYVHVCVYIYTHTRECVYSQPLYFMLGDTGIHVRSYGVARISRLLEIIGLFCQRALSKRRYSAKETYHFTVSKVG